MSEHHNHHKGNGFFNGFLLGAIIGAGAVFFLATPRGKKVLKVISEEGLEGISEIGGILTEEVKDKVGSVVESAKKKAKQVGQVADEIDEELEQVVEEPTISQSTQVHPNGEKSVAQKVSSSARRLFKGIHKKS